MFKWKQIVFFVIGSELLCSSGSEFLFVIGSELLYVQVEVKIAIFEWKPERKRIVICD